VRYYQRLKRGKAYNYVVTWDQEFAYKGPAQSVVIRLLAGGAQVVPSEVQLDPNDAADKAYFHVTPLAKGYLAGQKIEVVVNGKKVQEIQIISKAVTRRMNWTFLLLTFLAPWFILAFVKTSTMQRDVAKSVADTIARNVPATPDFIKDSIPAMHDGLISFRGAVADAAESFHLLAWEHPLAFYVGVTFFLLFLISLWIRRDKRKLRVGKPLFLPRTDQDEEDE